MKLIDLLVQELPKRGGWPEGLSQYLNDFLKRNKLTFFVNHHYSYFEDWDGDQVTREQYEAALAAAQEPVWDGEGLPPVGVNAEVSVDGGRSWCSYKATSENNGMRLVEIGNFTEEFQGNNWMFRPIRSEADRKRAAVVTALAKAGGDVHFEYGRKTIDGELSSPGWYKLYDIIAAGEIAGIRIE
ncbi:hypothetical protein SMZ64_000896 [Cronobacter malonaticus]|uniref:hypothetical protein n=1 Tax=Cronobacter malonaticus TaxID=413503 RepID=UPI0002FB3A6D|nr:hypothetical protein [Cronobacter malonaticus]ALX78312.1 hypothetical protein AFK66_021910 [Cronobacter malonaticus LMG 23826]EGT4280366.1 hypothetical protein [Cronobacter malonaticus]EGT4297581.1 hypothetical protein [Cronobacter malonaticus]ELY4445730.1 hypothetical protein [Cronobacter malonaticus]ELY4490569.1 hypothetical protein [Cronobacter malonaticus]